MTTDGKARSTRPDAVTDDALYVIKNVTRLRLTHQIRLTTFLAESRGLVAVITVPRTCQLSAPLLAFRDEHARAIRIAYLEEL